MIVTFNRCIVYLIRAVDHRDRPRAIAPTARPTRLGQEPRTLMIELLMGPDRFSRRANLLVTALKRCANCGALSLSALYQSQPLSCEVIRFSDDRRDTARKVAGATMKGTCGDRLTAGGLLPD